MCAVGDRDRGRGGGLSGSPHHSPTPFACTHARKLHWCLSAAVPCATLVRFHHVHSAACIIFSQLFFLFFFLLDLLLTTELTLLPASLTQHADTLDVDCIATCLPCGSRRVRRGLVVGSGRWQTWPKLAQKRQQKHEALLEKEKG